MSSLIDSNSRFATNPTRLLNVPRSQFDLSNTVKTSFNVGDLIPFDVQEVLPGDTFNVETNVLCRLQTLITPVMGNLYLDMYYFFVPNRLVWEHWKDFMGENTKSAWYPQTSYTIPQIKCSGTKETTPTFGSVLDYMGYPILSDSSYDVSTEHVNALPVRAYGLIYNEWFRDQNLIDPALVPTDDTSVSYDDNDPCKGGKPFKVAKYHDYFTSCLPSPQKGADVTIPMMSGGDFPVFTTNNYIPDNLMSGIPIRAELNVDIPNGHTRYLMAKGNGEVNKKGMDLVSAGIPLVPDGGGNFQNFQPLNLWSNIEGLPVATINQLRLAFATQRLYEKDARGGTRYIEILRSHFGVISPDARQQRPELLSYNHIPIQVQQIVQNSETNTTPQGTTTAISVTADSDGSFMKSFTEHGYIIGVCCARYKHSYQQGLNRLWSRKSRFDFYWPVFANIGEQPVLNKELYLSSGSNSSENDKVFGYQEAWADYRYKPDRVSAEMRSSYPQSLDVWHFADDYDKLPVLSQEWIQEDKNNVDRVLAVTSKNSNQLFMDLYIKNKATRPMPMYSIPGLLDHL